MGHLFEIRVWEQRAGSAGKDWAPNPMEVDAEVRNAFQNYRIIGFYADPSGWSEHVAKWEAQFSRRLQVKATQNAPISVWPLGKTSSITTVVDSCGPPSPTVKCSHDGAAALTRHVLNARRRTVNSGYLVFKAYPDSPDKIDAAYAAVMAWKARLDAVAKGVGERRPRAGKVIVF